MSFDVPCPKCGSPMLYESHPETTADVAGWYCQNKFCRHLQRVMFKPHTWDKSITTFDGRFWCVFDTDATPSQHRLDVPSVSIASLVGHSSDRRTTAASLLQEQDATRALSSSCQYAIKKRYLYLCPEDAPELDGIRYW